MEVHGDWKKLTKVLNRLENVDFAKLHDNIGEVLISTTHERFRNGRAPNGSKWKRGLKGTGQTLVQSRLLRNSITKRFSYEGVEVGTNVKYARIHQKGGTIRAKKAKFLRFKVGSRWAMKKSVKIPARPFIGISADDKQEIMRLFRETISEAMK